jgi:hypothetical protein
MTISDVNVFLEECYKQEKGIVKLYLTKVYKKGHVYHSRLAACLVPRPTHFSA